ncbi:hypothetical protein PLICRDRAFT_572812 [Plicaturopsis crispa FD-325 SS-3]|nr:hypothetical protein PLICRDRAFT_572812 [Plicaturopsis crispa FD-325 SS-3]
MSDFVIKRKRRRGAHHAVDPCLGFYIHSANAASTPDAESAPNAPSTPIRILPLAVAPKSPPSVPHIETLLVPSSDGTSSAITVEDFLRSSVAKSVKKYGRPKRRLADIANAPLSPLTPPNIHEGKEVDEDEQNQPKRPAKRRCVRLAVRSPSSMHRSSSPSKQLPTSPPHPPPRARKVRTRKPRRAKSAAHRLLEAALLSHGDPADCLLPRVSNAGAPRRQPLHFVPAGKESEYATASRAKTGLKTRSHKMQHKQPRKATRFVPTGFAIDAHVSSPPPPSDRNRRPVTNWRTVHFQTSPGPKQSNANPRKTRNATQDKQDPNANMNTKCPPLHFVPLKHADAVSMSKKGPTEPMPTLSEEPDPVAFPAPIKHAALGTARLPLPFAPLPVTPVLKSCPKPQLRLVLDRPAKSASKRVAFSSMGNVEPSTSAVGFPSSPLGGTHGFSRPRPAGDAPLIQADLVITQMSTNVSTGITPTSKRPLSSFLDGFLETARRATSTAQSNSNSSRKKRRTQAQMLGSDDVPTQTRITSFIRTSVRANNNASSSSSPYRLASRSITARPRYLLSQGVSSSPAAQKSSPAPALLVPVSSPTAVRAFGPVIGTGTAQPVYASRQAQVMLCSSPFVPLPSSSGGPDFSVVQGDEYVARGGGIDLFAGFGL